MRVCSEDAGHLLLLVQGDRLVVVETLGVQHLGQLALLPGRLLQLGSLVLEPDLDLILVEAELPGQVPPPLLGEVSVGLELVSQLLKLLGAEGGPGPLLVLGPSPGGSDGCGPRSWLLLLHLPDPGTGGGPVRVAGAEDPGRPQLTIGSPHHAGGTVLVCLRSLVGGLAEVHRNLDIYLGFWRTGFSGC